MDIFLYQNGAQTGPFTEQQVRDMVKSGKITMNDFGWRDGLADWQPLSQIISATAPPPTPASAPPPAYASGRPAQKSATPAKSSGGPGVGAIIAAVGILLFVGLAAWAGLVAFQRAQQNTAALKKMSQTQKDIVSDMRKSMQNPSSAPAAMQKEIDKYSQQMGGAASQMNGNAKKAAIAGQHFLELESAHMQKYNAAYQALQQVGFIQAHGLNTKDDLQNRRNLLNAFGVANKDVTDFCKNAEGTFRDQLVKADITSESDINEALDGFRKAGTMGYVLQIRQLDGDLIVQANKILDLYEQEWGKWKVEDDGNVHFENSAAVTNYNLAIGTIEQIADKQKGLQEQLLQRVDAATKAQ